MRPADEMIPDFSDLTCTNLMIRLRMLLKKAPNGIAVECYVRRDQRDTIEVPFSRSGYCVEVHKADTNRYRVSLTKREPEPDL